MQSEESPDYVPSDYEADSKVSPAAAQEDARLSFVRSAAAGDVSRMRDLLANSDPSTPPDRYRKLLSAAGHAAAEAGAVDVLRALAAAGLDVSAPVSAAPLQEELESTAGRKNLKLTSLIRLAAACGHAGAVRALAELGAPLHGYRGDGDVDAPDPELEASPLHAAARAGHVEVIRALLDLGADIGALCPAPAPAPSEARARALGRDPEDEELERMRSALSEAAEAGHVDAFLALAERGADVASLAVVSSGLRAGGTLLSRCAVLLSHERAVRFLEERGVPAARNAATWPWNGSPPLLHAAERGDTASVQFLLRAGARVDAASDCRTALYAAAGGGHVEVVMELLDAGAKLDTPCAAKIDLRRAAPRLWDDDFERFEKDPTTTDKASAPIPGFLHVPLKSAREKEVAVRALEAAAAAGSAEVVSLLLDRGCDGADLRASCLF
eukprot:tig00020611_g12097.t1